MSVSHVHTTVIVKEKIVIQYNSTLFSCVDWETKKKRKKNSIQHRKRRVNRKGRRQLYRQTELTWLCLLLQLLVLCLYPFGERLTIVNRGHEVYLLCTEQEKKEKKKKSCYYTYVSRLGRAEGLKEKFSFIVERRRTYSVTWKKERKKTRATVVWLTSHCRQVVSPHHLRSYKVKINHNLSIFPQQNSYHYLR
jgi:hypothetical protein